MTTNAIREANTRLLRQHSAENLPSPFCPRQHTPEFQVIETVSGPVDIPESSRYDEVRKRLNKITRFLFE